MFSSFSDVFFLSNGGIVDNLIRSQEQLSSIRREKIIVDGVEILRELKDGQVVMFEDEEWAGIYDSIVANNEDSTSEKASALYEFLLSSKSEETRKNYKSELQLFFKFLADHNFTTDEKKLEKLHLISYRDYLLKNKYAYKSIRKKISVVMSYLNYLADRGIIKKNKCILKNKELPVDQLVRPTEALTDEEAFKILEIARTNHADERMRKLHHAILSLFLATGMRKSELIDLKGNSYTEIEGIFYLNILGKGGKIRNVPLTERSKQALDEYLLMMKKYDREVKNEDAIFQPQITDDQNDNDLKRPCSTILIDKLIKRYCSLAGINKRITPHSLRATTITHLREQDADIYSISLLAGHASPETTKKYIKRAEELKKSAVFKSKF